MSTALTKAPAVDVAMLIRRPVHEVFEALADPGVTSRFWFTKSSGRMVEGAELVWDWEMYGARGNVLVEKVEPDRTIRFTWDGYDPSHPTVVEFRFEPHQADGTYLRITESGFSGDADTQVARALDSTAGFAFLLSSLKAALEHDVTLRVVLDAHPEGWQPA
jgi:uncharacterized protein YndB with AHSA1/START domain